ncbi:MAG: hypothetical protein JWN37_638 [Candidatus Nomurabacteria bacterium]|nr:hypothetical protein [Candidatus Nomurabacteria bacterium]
MDCCSSKRGEDMGKTFIAIGLALTFYGIYTEVPMTWKKFLLVPGVQAAPILLVGAILLGALYHAGGMPALKKIMPMSIQTSAGIFLTLVVVIPVMAMGMMLAKYHSAFVLQVLSGEKGMGMIMLGGFFSPPSTAVAPTIGENWLLPQNRVMLVSCFRIIGLPFSVVAWSVPATWLTLLMAVPAFKGIDIVWKAMLASGGWAPYFRSFF